MKPIDEKISFFVFSNDHVPYLSTNENINENIISYSKIFISTVQMFYYITCTLHWYLEMLSKV